MTYLYHLRFCTLPPGDVQQVWLEREGSEAGCLEGLPPFQKVLEASTITTGVNLELKLADGEAITGKCVDE